ncbi:hypothetical protein [Clostridium sp. OS1-26]|uniref:hypothetical protein n=1 Tax=Clostridium sp. OS1-26 TaxID=3070681 RepID=UPI0027E1E074|nr:hypothetical protein [Clostridium sp. OS1-26]WML32806.1 hypothetical protein RCG18_15695 [Clostridium sp. OS1-26]
MVKRNLKVMAALALVVSLGSGFVTVHAAALSNNAAANNSTKIEHKVKNKKDNANPIYSILESKLGFTKAQIQDAAKAGKTAFDLASEKGVTADQLKSMIIDAQSQNIDQMVSKGKLTQDKANTMKANLKTKMQNWNGSLKQAEHKKEGSNPTYSILESKLGFTKTQIQDAAKAGKTAFDLASEKGVTADQLKSMIIDAQSQNIDQMVSKGKLTQDKANTMKANLKTKMQNWNGSLKQAEHKKEGSNPTYSILESKLGFTKTQIQDAAKAGKTAFDLASEKGVTADQLKSMIIDAQSQNIDQMVSKGKLTQDKANTMKANLKTKMQNWNGSLGHKDGGK